MDRDLQEYLNKLANSPPDFTPGDLAECLELIFSKEIPPEQVAGLLVGLRVLHLDFDPQYIAAAAKQMRSNPLALDCPVADIVGTGGDGQNTFNVSTCAGIVAAGFGLKIAKHGNKASSSASGAADLLESLGAKVSCDRVEKVLENGNFCFLYAPVFYPIMAKIGQIRKNLRVATLFNILGPLLNPISVSSRVVGVYNQNLGHVFATAFSILDPNANTLIVWGSEGLDEISPAGTTYTWNYSSKTRQITNEIIHPSDFGIDPHPLSQVASGSPEDNAKTLNLLLNNQLKLGHPIFDYVVMNASALAVVSGLASSYKEGVKLAIDSIQSKSAKHQLDEYIRVSNM